MKLDCITMACTLGAFIETKAEEEPQLDQVNNMSDFLVEGGGSHRHDGVNNSQGGEILLLDWGIFYPISFELSGKALV